MDLQAALSNAVISAQLDFCKKLVAFAQDDIWSESFKNKLESGNLVDIAIMCKMELPTIKIVYEANPPVVSNTAALACMYGKPGVLQYLAEKKPAIISENLLGLACEYSNFDVISFLARQKPKGVSQEYRGRFEVDEYPISLAMQGGAPESDIRKLVELWPEGVAKSMSWNEADSELSTPLQMCLRKGYSKELLGLMTESLPSSTSRKLTLADFPATADDLDWLEKVFVNSCAVFKSGKDFKWNGSGYQDFLGLLFQQDNGIKELDLALPSQLEDVGAEDDLVAVAMAAFAKSTEPPTNAMIEKLSLSLPHPSYCGLLDCLYSWSCLRELVLDVGNYLDLSMAALCKLLEHGRLQDLKITAKPSSMKSKKRKGASEDVVVVPLQPFFDALAPNTTVSKLEIAGLGDEEQKTEVAKLILDALKKNTTLENVVLRGVESQGIELGFVHRIVATQYSAGKQVRHFLNLNRCGRKVARDASTRLADFVDLLGSVQRALGTSNVNKAVTSIQYGLLREAVGKWASQ